MITFNSNNLSSTYLIVNRINKSDAPQRELQNETLSFQDGFVTMADFWRSRTVVIGGTIDATSTGHLGDLLDTLKQNLSGVNKNLDVDYGSGTRRYKATMSRLEAPEDFYNITHLPYTAEFTCQPFGYATSPTNFSSNDITGASETDSVTIDGTYPAQPVITIEFTASSGASAVSFTNNETAETITIEETFSTDDVLVINTENHKVTLEGTQVDFDGPMIAFELGSNSFTLDIDSTSHTVDLDIDFTATFL